MAEIKKLYQVTAMPGTKRDGTILDNDHFVDSQWVRFNRGRPKKMGGYRELSTTLPGVTRSLVVWSRGPMNALICASSSAIVQATMDAEGGTGSAYDRTPEDMPTFDGCWTLDSMYDDASGSENTIIVAHKNSALQSIDELTAHPVYWAVANNTEPFEPIAGLEVSGGIVCISPYLVYYGSDGLVGWSDINQPRVLDSGDAGRDRITGSKIVKALPLRTGSGPGAMLWSLDSVLRMEYVGGSSVFRFSTVSAQSSILAQNSVIEYDGDYFWVGIDRFLVYSGGKAQELPNSMNRDWFFDSLNYAHRQKVWATKVTKYGEIIWFFPRETSTECNHAVVYNVNEKTWYDFELSRSAGYYAQVFRFPVWAGDSSFAKLLLIVDNGASEFALGDSVTESGDTSATVYDVLSDTQLVVYFPTTPRRELSGALTNNSNGATTNLLRAIELHTPYIHERGLNAVTEGGELAIKAYCETSNFGLPSGGVVAGSPEGLNNWTSLVRVEPDLVQAGPIDLQVLTREYARGNETESEVFTFGPETGKIDMRKQGRQIRLRFTSNTLNGNFEMGRTILHTEPGD
jgi:hypothetical protein